MSQPIQRVGQYNFLKKLGVGRMAEVYLGRIEGAEGFQKPVAIKKILPHLSSDLQFVQSLIAEARVGGQLHHRNIVEVYDFIRYGNDYCIIMEYVDGVDLGRILRSARRYRVRIPPAAALYIASHICDGLDYAHSARGFNGEPLNIIHRDLKPSNVLISIKGGVKISDFGVARVMEQAVQRSSNDVKISYQYQSPEQATGRTRLTSASDIFSVGVILFEMLTLEPLFPGKNVIEVLEGLREADFTRRLALAQRQLPGSEKILGTALNPNPDGRYRTAALMAEDLRRLLLYLKVDDPRERLVTFFARLVRFVQEQGKRPATDAAQQGQELGDEGAQEPEEAGQDVEPGRAIHEEVGEEDIGISGQVAYGEAPPMEMQDSSSMPVDVSYDARDVGGRMPEAPPPPGEASTYSQGDYPDVASEHGYGEVQADVPGTPGQETWQDDEYGGYDPAQQTVQPEMPMGMPPDHGGMGGQPEMPSYMAEMEQHGEPAGETTRDIPPPDLSWGQGGDTMAMPLPGTSGVQQMGTVPLNPEETRIGTYATVEAAAQAAGLPVPETQVFGPIPGGSDSTRIINVAEGPPAGAPGMAPSYEGQRAITGDQTVDTGDGTALMEAPAEYVSPGKGRSRLLLMALGLIAMLALGGGGVAFWKHLNGPSDAAQDNQATCPTCGHVLPADAEFCSFCGAVRSPKGQQKKEPELVKCPHCGADNEKGSVFCGNCGQKLENP